MKDSICRLLKKTQRQGARSEMECWSIGVLRSINRAITPLLQYSITNTMAIERNDLDEAFSAAGSFDTEVLHDDESSSR